jgi:hypothetical protein
MLTPSLLLALTLAAAGAQQPAARASASLARIAWLAGNWTGSVGEATIEERWTPAAGGVMLAVSRTVKGERLAAFEFLRIMERDGGLIYIAQPNGRPPTEFTLTDIDESSATFENPTHDFPKVIRYTRKSDGSLEARVSGSNGERPQTFLFTRAER